MTTRDLQTISDEMSTVMKCLIGAAMAGDDKAREQGTNRLIALTDEYTTTAQNNHTI